jgi:hypothetical protein
MRSFIPSNNDSRLADERSGSMRSAFFNLLTGPELLEVTESHLPEHRERLYRRR